MDWYYKLALIFALVWGAARALGVYGEAARQLDIAFIYGFLVTMGGWGAVFFIVDRVLKFFGWKREATRSAAEAGSLASSTAADESDAPKGASPTDPESAPPPAGPVGR